MERRDFVKSSALTAGAIALVGPRLSAAGSAQAGSTTATSMPAPPAVDAATRDLLMEALDAATGAGAGYADARVGLYRNRRIGTRERRVTNVSESDSLGLGVRAFVSGSWGFAATREMSREAAVRAGRKAAAIGAANARVERSPVTLAPVEPYGDVSWSSSYEIDPWDVPIGDKVQYLLDLNEVALATQGVSFVSSELHFVKIETTSATTEGTIAAQRIIRVNPQMSITAVAPDRSDFQSRGAVLDPAGRGWEYIRDRMTPEAVEVWASEAVQKLSAAAVEPGPYDLVLHPSNLWLTIHESIGHPTELDRALGYEANYAGTSFLAPPSQVIGRTRYGPEFMQIVGERTSEGGLATIGWDEEGVKAQEWPLIENGIFVDYQTTREQVAWISDLTGIQRSHGCSHAQNWSSIPFQRMPNINLLPALEDVTLEDVIGATDRGIYVESRGSYSIDQQRYNFQFGGQVFWEIRGGKKTRMLRDLAYQARTLDFWNAMDMIGGAGTYYVGGSFYDGKGQPGQVNAVSHGCPVARFHQINILNTGRRQAG
jgi:TldD protein